MTLRYYDYKCPNCPFTIESLQPINTETVDVDCVTDEQLCCRLERVTTNIPKHVKIDIEAKAFVPLHTERARNLGHDGATAKTEGQYDSEPRKGYKSKVMVGPTKR